MQTNSYLAITVYVYSDFLNPVTIRMIYRILSHQYDIISGIFPKYLQMTKKINTTFQHKFSIFHGSTVDSILSVILLSTCFVKSVRKTHRTHAEYNWSVYLLACCLICKFHWFWRSNRYLFRDHRVKILACSMKRSVILFVKW